jgi:hypothetical protein
MKTCDTQITILVTKLLSKQEILKFLNKTFKLSMHYATKPGHNEKLAIIKLASI